MPAAKNPPGKTRSKADRVRAMLDKGQSVKEIARVLASDGVTSSYAWDIAAANEKKTGALWPSAASRSSLSLLQYDSGDGTKPSNSEV